MGTTSVTPTRMALAVLFLLAAAVCHERPADAVEVSAGKGESAMSTCLTGEIVLDSDVTDDAAVMANDHARGRLLPDVAGVAASKGSVSIKPVLPGARFTQRSGGGRSQVAGIVDAVPGTLTARFQHRSSCEGSLLVEVSGDGTALLRSRGGGGMEFVAQVGRPWAIDADGQELPTWYRASGAVLEQVIDASDARGPIVFDPTYSNVFCSTRTFTGTATAYLDFQTSDSPATCPPHTVFWNRKTYSAVWGFETNVANDYGKILLKQNGGCSHGPDTGPSWDFQVPCKAHDYCYDLIEAGFVANLIRFDCNNTFYYLMEAHCNNRVFSGDCRYTRDTYYAAVDKYGNPVVSPAYVSLRPWLNSNKCADVRGPSSADGTPIQNYTCFAVSQQRFRFSPAAGNSSYYEIQSQFASKCADVDINTPPPRFLTIWPCGTGLTQRHFRISSVGGDVWEIRSRYASLQTCWDLPYSDSSDGNRLVEWWCDGQSKQRWLLY